MALSSSLRSRRSSPWQAAPTHQILVFRLHQDWFALLVQVVHKVIPLEPLYGMHQTQFTYLTEGSIRCVSTLVVSNQKHPPLFLLNLNSLMQSETTLSAGSDYGY